MSRARIAPHASWRYWPSVPVERFPAVSKTYFEVLIYRFSRPACRFAGGSCRCFAAAGMAATVIKVAVMRGFLVAPSSCAANPTEISAPTAEFLGADHHARCTLAIKTPRCNGFVSGTCWAVGAGATAKMEPPPSMVPSADDVFERRFFAVPSLASACGGAHGQRLALVAP